MSHWIFENKRIEHLPEGVAGFVYKITNLENGRIYIGRKYATSKKRKPLTKKQVEKGRVRRDVHVTESDWATYTGSNLELNDDIKRIGKLNFRFEILHFCKTRGAINYLEEALHYRYNVLFDDIYYNSSVGPRRYLALKNNKELQRILL